MQAISDDKPLVIEMVAEDLQHNIWTKSAVQIPCILWQRNIVSFSRPVSIRNICTRLRVAHWKPFVIR